MPLDRLKLIQQLNGLPLVQFNALVFALQTPAGSMPTPSASQGDRVFVLLSWAEGYGGCGLPRLQQVLEQLLTHQTQPLSNNHDTTTTATGTTATGTTEEIVPVLVNEQMKQMAGLDGQKDFDLGFEQFDLEAPGFDDLLKLKSEELFVQLIDIRRKVIPTLRSIPITEYSHDSVSHAFETVNILYKLFKDALSCLTAEELFVTAVFCLIHDIGMIPRSGLSPKQLYASHNSSSSRYVKELKIPYSNEISALCLTHNKCLEEAKAYIADYKLRLDIIFCMFRVSDMLDVEIQPGAEILRINKEFLERSIADIDIRPSSRSIIVKRNFEVNEQQFQHWIQYFDNRLSEFNQILEKVNHAYKVVY